MNEGAAFFDGKADGWKNNPADRLSGGLGTEFVPDLLRRPYREVSLIQNNQPVHCFLSAPHSTGNSCGCCYFWSASLASSAGATSSSSSSFSSPSSSLSDETCVLLRFLMNGCYFLSIGGQLNEPGRWIFICVCVCASAMDFFSCVFPGSGTVSPLGDALDSLTHPRNHS